MYDSVLIPYLCGAGATVPGCEESPLYAFEQNLHRALNSEWAYDPKTKIDRRHKNLPAIDTSERHEIIRDHCHVIKETVKSAINQKKLPLTIGGDHSIAAGSLDGLAKAFNAYEDIGLIWVDAHADINTYETSPSKSLHGMPLAALFGLNKNDMQKFGLEKSVLKPEHIFYLGLRSVDTGEQELINKLGIKALTTADVSSLGPQNAFEKAYSHVSGCKTLAISVDLDVLDPGICPAVGSPVPHGMELEELVSGLRVLKNKKIDLFETAEFNATLNGKNQTFSSLKIILETILNV